jgi:hypothetical protein
MVAAPAQDMVSVLSGWERSKIGRWVYCTLGRVRWKTAPTGLRGDAHSLPPNPSMIDRQMERPKPIPWDFVVKNGSKMRWR